MLCSTLPCSYFEGIDRMFTPSPALKRSRVDESGTPCARMGTTSGYEVMKTPLRNHGVAFTTAERRDLGVEGLVPGAVLTLDQRVERAMMQMETKSTPYEKYLYLQSLQDTDETLYYAVLTRHTATCMPLVYTPVVGEGCQKWSMMHNDRPRGLYLNLSHKGRVKEVMSNWPYEKISAIVVTDGERILGLGDLGLNGMGIPVGKLALYTACAGVNPQECLPVSIDVGTNNNKLIEDPFYLGLKHPRVQGEEYDAFIEEFMVACTELYGRECLIQWEDFGNTNAFRLLGRYQKTHCSFNDDIQGTASVVLGCLLASLPLTGVPLKDHTFLFLGAGEAGVGISELIAFCMVRDGAYATMEEARSKIWLIDSAGLVTGKRDLSKLQHHKLPYAHTYEGDKYDSCVDLLSSVEALRPTAIIGVSAQPRTFTPEIIKRMSEINANPIIFALSNPTTKSECTAEEAYTHSEGRAIFASGSPFDPVTLADGSVKVPGQANNAYVFPGVALGAICVKSTLVDDEDMYIAARAMAAQVTPDRLAVGCVCPPLSQIREVSAIIAEAVAENAYRRGSATLSPKPEDMLAHVQASMYQPSY